MHESKSFPCIFQRWLRAKQQRRLYLEDRRKVVNIQRTVRRWLARRHKAAATIQQATRKFLHLRHQERVRQGIVKAQVLYHLLCLIGTFINVAYFTLGIQYL